MQKKLVSHLLVMAFAFVLNTAVFAQSESASKVDTAFAELRAWDGAKEGAANKTVRGYVDRATTIYKVRQDAEKRLIDIIESKDAGKPAKKFAAEQLYRISDEDTVPAFARMLEKPDTWDLACKGLQRVKHAKAEHALIDGAANAKGERLIGILEALGNRHDPAAVPLLKEKADDADQKITQASLTSLGKIPGADSMKALDWCRKNLTRKMRPAATQAYLNCGQTSLAMGDTKTAITLFEALMNDFEPVEIQAEGLRGLIKAKGDAAVPTIIEALTSGIPQFETIAAAEAHTVPGTKATQAFIAAYPDLTNANQAVLLKAMGERRDEAALPTVLLAAQSRVPKVRRAALEALGKFNNPDAIQVLLKATVGGPADEQEVARTALANIGDPKFNDALLIAAMSADNAVRAEAIKMLAARDAHEGVPVLLRIAQKDVKTVRLEALKALGKVGTISELPPMAGMLTNEWTNEERAAIGQAIIQVARRSPEGKQRIEPITRQLSASSVNDEVRLTLVSILGAVGDDASLPALESAAKKPGRVQLAAVETLAGWANPAPLDTLDKVARSDKDPAVQSAAIEGVLRHLDRNPSVPESQRLKYLGNLAGVAQSPEQKERIAQSLGAISDPNAQKVRQKLSGSD